MRNDRNCGRHHVALLFLLFLLFLFFMQHVRWALCKNVAPPAPLLPPSSGGGHTTARPRPGGAFPEWRFLPLRTNRFLTSDAKEVLRTKQINPPFPSNSSCSRFSFSSNFSFPFCFNSSDMISIRFSFFPLTISFFFIWLYISLNSILPRMRFGADSLRKRRVSPTNLWTINQTYCSQIMGHQKRIYTFTLSKAGASS